MKNLFKSGIAAGLLCLTTAFPSLADVTAQELRDEIVSFYKNSGYEITIGSEDQAGGTLTLRDVTAVLDIPDDSGEIIVGLGDIVLRETGDGSVEVEPSSNIVFNMHVTPEGEDDVVVKGSLDLRNMMLRASGSMDALKLASASDGGSFRITSFEVDGDAMPVSGVVDFGATASNSTIVKKTNDRRRVSGDTSVASIKVSGGARDPKGDGFLAFAASLDNLVSIFSVEAKKTEDIEDFMSSGFSGDVTLTYGASEIDMSFQDGNDRFAMTTDARKGKFAFALSTDLIEYEIAQEGVNLTMSSSELPIPSVNLSYDELVLAFGVPLSKSDQPGYFHLKTALRGLEVSEAIWSMVDPGQILPRDPAAFALDITGTVMVLANLMNPKTLEVLEDMDKSPMVPVSINLEELTAEIAGVLLKGSGKVTFDADSPVKIGGVPIPVGDIDLRLEGAYGLMDKLMQIGLLPDDASMGMRAMLGAFAKPVGDDKFESNIAFTESGGITANGQRIQ